MGLYALCGLETEKKLRVMARNFMILDINKRKDYVKSFLLSGTGRQTLGDFQSLNYLTNI